MRLRCWPGCLAMVTGGGPFNGRTITCTELDPNYPNAPPAWLYVPPEISVEVKPGVLVIAQSFFDHGLTPLTPRPEDQGDLMKEIVGERLLLPAPKLENA